ncbi:hypothetical protein B5E80_16620 [Flavonifractor sp. An135]|nr:M56 family metallopeptidase [Flavonifractor sp. An135]OUQ21232.1 hypothetical protein B5E80_16620 [Flavonifractor sp. An135]
MTDLWCFLQQTLAATLAALVLLAVKRILGDKLSPRWQLALWLPLAVRLLLPVGAPRAGGPVDLTYPLTFLRSAVELHLNSAYTDPYAPIACLSPVPWLTGAPVSVTDWLFVIYAVGVLVCLGWFLLSYVRLRMAVGKGTPAGARAEQLSRVAETYGLKPCRALEVEGVQSAFLCGVFRPVLVLPAGREVDDKVFLHELLHRRYRDTALGAVLCLLRCLHWCNPILWYCFDRVQNDCEALCDQRVLERLEGEDRRDYGHILLSMANEKYARAPGTSSMANGGKNIRRRIQCIARFKRYPAGMALGAVCCTLVLTVGCVAGRAEAGTLSASPAWGSSPAKVLTLVLDGRPTTVAGALDTYVKGLVERNPLWLAAAAPAEELPGALEVISSGVSPDWPLPEEPLDWKIYNLWGTGAGYQGTLCLQNYETAGGGEGDPPVYTQEVLVVPQYQGYAVEPLGEFETVDGVNLIQYPNTRLSALHYTGGDGEVSVRLDVQRVLGAKTTEDQSSSNGVFGSFFSSGPSLRVEPLPHGPFVSRWHSEGGVITAADGRDLHRTLYFVPVEDTDLTTEELKEILERQHNDHVNLPAQVGDGSGGVTDEYLGLDWDECLAPTAFAASCTVDDVEHFFLLTLEGEW